MKIWWLFVVLSLASLLVMAVVDFRLGAKAEFLNAWSVIERLLGREASAGWSVVARAFGAAGELVCVVVVNMIVGGVLTLLAKIVVAK